MKKINFKILIITCIACLLPIVLGVVFYNDLPDKIAIHFDINNNPDNYFSKSLFVFGMPVIMAIIQIICCITNDLQDKNPEANKKVTSIFKWIIPIIAIVMYTITLMYALGNLIDIRKVVMIILGTMFIVMGNYTPKTVGNTHLNFPKIKSEQVYAKVKRIFGYIFIINGILFIVSILFDVMISVGLVGLIILEAIILLIYTIIKNKQES